MNLMEVILDLIAENFEIFPTECITDIISN